MTQTAVDWMFDHIWETPKDKLAWFKILMEAKQIHEQQIKEAYDTGVWDVGCRNSDSKRYYNETYGKK
jgi:hypothetical protein